MQGTRPRRTLLTRSNRFGRLMDHRYAGSRAEAVVVGGLLLNADLIVFAHQLLASGASGAADKQGKRKKKKQQQPGAIPDHATTFQDSYTCLYQFGDAILPHSKVSKHDAAASACAGCSLTWTPTSTVQDTTISDKAVFGDVELDDVIVGGVTSGGITAATASNDWFTQSTTILVTLKPNDATGVTVSAWPQWLGSFAMVLAPHIAACAALHTVVHCHRLHWRHSVVC